MDHDYARTALKAAIAAVLIAEVIDSAVYLWRRAARRMQGWEARVEHRQRMQRYGAEVRSLEHRLSERT